MFLPQRMINRLSGWIFKLAKHVYLKHHLISYMYMQLLVGEKEINMKRFPDFHFNHCKTCVKGKKRIPFKANI